MLHSQGRVAVATGLAEHPPGTKHARPADQARLQRLGDPYVESTGVAHCGEAPAKHPFQDHASLDPDPRRAPPGHGLDVQSGDGRMDVRIDEARHHSRTPRIQHIDVVGDLRRVRVDGHLDDPVALHPNRGAGKQFPGTRIEQAGVGDQHICHQVLLWWVTTYIQS